MEYKGKLVLAEYMLWQSITKRHHPQNVNAIGIGIREGGKIVAIHLAGNTRARDRSVH